jgi:hypothetical protein
MRLVAELVQSIAQSNGRLVTLNEQDSAKEIDSLLNKLKKTVIDQGKQIQELKALARANLPSQAKL